MNESPTEQQARVRWERSARRDRWDELSPEFRAWYAKIGQHSDPTDHGTTCKSCGRTMAEHEGHPLRCPAPHRR